MSDLINILCQVPETYTIAIYSISCVHWRKYNDKNCWQCSCYVVSFIWSFNNSKTALCLGHILNKHFAIHQNKTWWTWTGLCRTIGRAIDWPNKKHSEKHVRSQLDRQTKFHNYSSHFMAGNCMQLDILRPYRSYKFSKFSVSAFSECILKLKSNLDKETPLFGR